MTTTPYARTPAYATSTGLRLPIDPIGSLMRNYGDHGLPTKKHAADATKTALLSNTSRSDEFSFCDVLGPLVGLLEACAEDAVAFEQLHPVVVLNTSGVHRVEREDQADACGRKERNIVKTPHRNRCVEELRSGGVLN